MRRLFLSLRNILFYRSPRFRYRRFVEHMQATKSLEEMKRLLTKVMLANVGLKLDGAPTSGVYLTACQREAAEKAEAFGYRAGI